MMRLLRISAGALFAALAIAACSEETAPPSTPNLPSLDTGYTTPTSAPTTDNGGGGGGATTGNNGGGGGQAAASGTINIENFQYGEPLTVAPGARITVTNKDSAPHDAVADDGSFKTDVLGQNESGTFTAPTTPGTYKFSCTLHSNMTGIGTLVVQG